MATISFQRVNKRFGDQVIVSDLDLAIADGELVVLVGGSGCGKSTTLRMLAGLESVSSGSIRIGERDVTHLDPRDRDVAMVFQDYALYPHLSAYDNMALGLKLKKVARPEIERRVKSAAELLGLGPLLERKPKAMSGGQRQRVAIGRAIVREPAAFLFDEPLSNLDAHLRTQMRVEIHGIQRRLGVTSLYVTHDQVEAMTLADRLVILDRGTIQQVGRPIDVYRGPANRFVANFIGSPAMNFFRGELGGDHTFTAPGLRIQLPAERRPDEAGEVTLGVRPQDIALAGDAPGLPSVRGRVRLAERLGGTTHLHVDVAGQQVVAAIARDCDVSADDNVELAIDHARVHLFGPDGRALTGPVPAPQSTATDRSLTP
jgi:multiple sugar transport system ATP-binding protein